MPYQAIVYRSTIPDNRGHTVGVRGGSRAYATAARSSPGSYAIPAMKRRSFIPNSHVSEIFVITGFMSDPLALVDRTSDYTPAELCTAGNYPGCTSENGITSGSWGNSIIHNDPSIAVTLSMGRFKYNSRNRCCEFQIQPENRTGLPSGCPGLSDVRSCRSSESILCPGHGRTTSNNGCRSSGCERKLHG
jgi:hypothetical protein